MRSVILFVIILYIGNSSVILNANTLQIPGYQALDKDDKINTTINIQDNNQEQSLKEAQQQTKIDLLTFYDPMARISAKIVNKLMQQSTALVIDVRPKKQLRKGMIMGALAIDPTGSFTHWVRVLLSPEKNYFIFGEQQLSKYSIRIMLGLGFKNIFGYCDDSIEQFQYYIPDFVPTVNIENRVKIDIRRREEWLNGVAEGEIVLLQLSRLFQLHEQVLSKEQKYVIYCQSGYRARIAYSFLKSQGYDVKVYVDGGFPNLRALGVKIVRPKI